MTVLDIPRQHEAQVCLPVHVVDTEGDFSVCTGLTVGVGLNGVLLHLLERLPSTCETTVQIELPDGSKVVTAAVVASGAREGLGWTYRLAFPHLEDSDTEALTALLRAA